MCIKQEHDAYLFHLNTKACFPLDLCCHIISNCASGNTYNGRCACVGGRTRRKKTWMAPLTGASSPPTEVEALCRTCISPRKSPCQPSWTSSRTCGLTVEPVLFSWTSLCTTQTSTCSVSSGENNIQQHNHVVFFYPISWAWVFGIPHWPFPNNRAERRKTLGILIIGPLKPYQISMTYLIDGSIVDGSAFSEHLQLASSMYAYKSASNRDLRLCVHL